MYVSNITGCCFQHLLGDPDPPSANEPRTAMEPGLLPHRDSRPSKVCTRGYNPVRVPRSMPHCSSLSLSYLSPSVDSCPKIACHSDLLGGLYKPPPDLRRRFPRTTVTPILCDTGGNNDYSGASDAVFCYIRNTSHWCWWSKQKYRNQESLTPRLPRTRQQGRLWDPLMARALLPYAAGWPRGSALAGVYGHGVCYLFNY